MAKKKNLSKFCSPIFKNAQSIKNIANIAINIIFIASIIGIANIEKLTADKTKYNTCLKLRYPPNIFSSRFISYGTL